MTASDLPSATAQAVAPLDWPPDVARYLSTMAELQRRFSRTLPDDLREELEGVTAHQCEALVCIAMSADRSTTMNDLARNQGVTMSTCTALVDRLQRQGMVERAADPTDRRVVRVVPTERGLRLIELFRAHKVRVARHAISALTPDELETLLSLMRRMLAVELTPEEPA